MNSSYQIQFEDAALRELKRIDKPIANRILERIHYLEEHIASIKPEPLTDHLSGLYKFRMGDYRIIYEILHQEKIIIIHLVGHRREIYRKLE